MKLGTCHMLMALHPNYNESYITCSYNGVYRAKTIDYSKPYRVNHVKSEFARGPHHIDGIESFWRFAKHRLQKFQGIRAAYVLLALERMRRALQRASRELDAELLKLLTNIRFSDSSL